MIQMKYKERQEWEDYKTKRHHLRYPPTYPPFFFVFLRTNGFPYDKNTERYPALPNLNLPSPFPVSFFVSLERKGFPFEMELYDKSTKGILLSSPPPSCFLFFVSERVQVDIFFLKSQSQV